MFELQQGIKSPRDGSVNWNTFDVYETRGQAVREGKKNKGLWRVVESRVVWSTQPEQAQ